MSDGSSVTKGSATSAGGTAPEGGRTFLVTGCSSGIGRAVCERLLAAGHGAVGVARRPERAGISHPRFEAHRLDLAALDSLPGRLGALLEARPRVAGAVLSAGAGLFAGLEELAPETIRRHVDLNLTSHMLVTRALVPRLKRRGGGDIVIVGSEAALRGRRRGTVYCAARFGLRGFAQALREEGARSGIRVALVNPGTVRTPFFDELDFEPGADEANALLPEEIADVVVHVIEARRGVVFDEIDLTPLKRVVRLRGGAEKGPDARPE